MIKRRPSNGRDVRGDARLFEWLNAPPARGGIAILRAALEREVEELDRRQSGPCAVPDYEWPIAKRN